MTAQDIIQAALEELGIIGATDVPAAADANRGLAVLNAMIDSWSNENLMTFVISELSTVLVPGKSAYTIGTGTAPPTDIVAVRPLNIQGAYIQDPQGNNYPVEIYERDRWNMLQNRQQQSQIPSVLFYDETWPAATINLYPVPSIDYTLFFDAYLQLTAFPLLTTTFSLPPGYEDAMVHNLAVRLSPYFGIQPLDVTKDLAAETKGIIKRTNLREVIADFDPELTRGGSGGTNLERFRQGR